MNIYVSNLSRTVNSSNLSKHFAPYGNISSVHIVTDKFTNESKGYAFVEMENNEGGRKAISELNGTVLGDRNIVVSEAKPRRERTEYRERW